MTSTIRNLIALPLALSALAMLGGCASALNTADTSEFTCHAKTGCPTPFEVYNDTNNAPSAVRNGRTPEKWKDGKAGAANKDDAGKQQPHFDLTTFAPGSNVRIQAEPPAQPIREASQVMRIWVAPWIDQGDNLNWTGYIYTEVTPKRWSFGEQEVRHQGIAPQFAPQTTSAR